MSNQELENRFKYHAPKDGQQEKYVRLREKAKELAYLMQDLCPPSRELHQAMVELESSNMWANASIARSR
jgi:hypothetical protein